MQTAPKEFKIGSYVWLKPEYTGRRAPLKVRVTHALKYEQQEGKAIEVGGTAWIFSAADTCAKPTR